jgi:hypothetical protein
LSPVNIDHIAVGPPGVFVVDSKNWAGRVRLDERGMASNGYRRDAELLSATTMAEAVHDVAASAASHAVTRPVLAFVQDVGIAEPSPHRGVVCLQASHLLPWLTRQPAVLTPQEVQRVGATLNAAFPPRAGSAKPLTVATLEQYRGGVAPAQRQRAASATRPAPAAPRRKRGAGAPRPLPQRLARVLLELSLRLVLLAIFVVVVLPLILASFMDGLKENLTELPAPRAPATAPPAAPVP